MIKVKNRKGITLITLVVTIIVLLILAGISLNILLGENGIIKKSKETQEIEDVARISEKLELLKAPILIEEQSVNLENYLTKLNDFVEEYDINNVDKIDETNAYVVAEGKYQFLIKDEKNGNVIIIYKGLAGALVLSEGSGIYTYPETKTFTVIKNESGGALSVTSSNENIATATISENTITVTAGTTAGTAKIIVTSEATEKYGKNAATYTATVKNGTITLEATAYTGNYDGSAHNAITNVEVTPSDAKVEYSLDGGDYSTTIPQVTNAGEYSVSIKASKAGYTTKTITKTVTQGKKTTGTNTGDLVLSATSGTHTYPTAGTFTVTKNVSNGTLSVTSSNENIAKATISGTTITVIPGTTAGIATITVKSAATSNYEEQTATYTATVKNGTITLEATAYTGNYDGSAHNAITNVEVTPSDAKVEYSLDGGDYSTTIPQVTNAGEYSVSIKASKAGYTTKTMTKTITQNVNKGATAAAANKTYNGSVQKGVTGSNVDWTGNTTGTNAGTYTAYATPKANYAWSDGTRGKKTITWKINPAEITLEATAYTGNYDGKSHNAVSNVKVTPSDAKVEYSINGGSTYSTTIPTVTGTNTYSIIIRASKTNYTTKTITKTVTVKQGTASTLKVGDYVKYTPTAKAYTVGKATSGTSADQSFNTNTYTGLWRVLYNDSTNGLQLISASSVINLAINGKTGYNNLVGTLNSVAGNYVNTTYADSARSVGSTPSSNASTTGTTSIYTNSTYAFIANSANDLKVADTNYTSDQAVLESKGMLNITGDYWMASRYIYIDANGAGFQGALVGTFNDYTGLASILLKCVHADGSGQDHSYTAGVRPVVKLKSTVKINSGAGTASSPWTLGI